MGFPVGASYYAHVRGELPTLWFFQFALRQDTCYRDARVFLGTHLTDYARVRVELPIVCLFSRAWHVSRPARSLQLLMCRVSADYWGSGYLPTFFLCSGRTSPGGLELVPPTSQVERPSRKYPEK